MAESLVSGSSTWARTRDLRINSGLLRPQDRIERHPFSNKIKHLRELNRTRTKVPDRFRSLHRYHLRYQMETYGPTQLSTQIALPRRMMSDV